MLPLPEQSEGLACVSTAAEGGAAGLRAPCRETMEPIVGAAGWMEERTGVWCQAQGTAYDGNSKLPQPRGEERFRDYDFGLHPRLFQHS